MELLGTVNVRFGDRQKRETPLTLDTFEDLRTMPSFRHVAWFLVRELFWWDFPVIKWVYEHSWRGRFQSGAGPGL